MTLSTILSTILIFESIIMFSFPQFLWKLEDANEGYPTALYISAMRALSFLCLMIGIIAFNSQLFNVSLVIILLSMPMVFFPNKILRMICQPTNSLLIVFRFLGGFCIGFGIICFTFTMYKNYQTIYYLF